MPRGDGKLYVTCISMGQGDCIIASLPNGKTIMIDCGTARWDTDFNRGADKNQSKADQNTQILSLRKQALDVVFEDKFLNGYNTIDALVLTHPDKDHCNELQSFLASKNPAITNVYFSYGQLTKYIEGGAGAWLLYKANVTQQRYNVTINRTTKTLSGTAIANAVNATDINVVSTNANTAGFVKILHGTHAAIGADNCEVFLLAGDVDTYPNINDGSTDKNRGSLVVLIVFGASKLMFCGDSTFNTEKFLKDTYGAKIQNLELFQMPHHGSLTSSSCSAYGTEDALIKAIGFVDFVNPIKVIVSAATDSGASLKLPRYETVQKYLNIPASRLRARATNTLHCWNNVPAVYTTKGRKRSMQVAAYNDWQERAVDFEILSTGTLGTVDYTYP